MKKTERILFVVVHHFNPDGDGSCGCLRNDPSGRAKALGDTIASLHDLFNRRTVSLDFRTTYVTRPANTDTAYEVDVKIVTPPGMNVIDRLAVDPALFEVVHTDAKPPELGFTVNDVFREHAEDYDWYAYIEDDIIIHDPLFFAKLRWFQSETGPHAVLQPNRYEVNGRDGRGKIYVDGDLVPDQVARFRRYSGASPRIFEREQLGRTFRFRLAPNPHSGCYFLTRAQLVHWLEKPWYSDRDSGFVRAMESAASLGIMRTFDVYKPDVNCAAFLEVQHCGEALLAEMVPPKEEGARRVPAPAPPEKPREYRLNKLEADLKDSENRLRQYRETPLALRNTRLEGEIRRLSEIVRNRISRMEHACLSATRNPASEDNMNYTVTAVIPLYNGKEYIQRAVESVVSQTLAPLELIVVDDGSTDDSPEIVKNMEAPFEIKLVRQENAGQSAARNHAARLAKGKILAFLDQDDIWYPDHLDMLSAPFLLNPRIGWTYSDLDEIDRNGELIMLRRLSALGIAHPKRAIYDLLYEDMFILPSASLVLKSAFEEIGGFDERLMGYEDDDLFLRLFRAGYAHEYIPEALSQWRIRHDSASYSDRMAQSRDIYARKLIEAFPDEPLMARYYKRDCIGPRFYNNALRQYLKSMELDLWEECGKSLERMKQYNGMLGRNILGTTRRFLRHGLMKRPRVYRSLHDFRVFLFARLS